MNNVISATYSSSWDDYKKIFESKCKINLETGVVFDVGQSELINLNELNLAQLDEECVIFAGVDYPIRKFGGKPVVTPSSLNALRLISERAPLRLIKNNV